ncbi:MAG: alpha/beta fold hydrolase [Planctomycetes bacterium]|nr:alpha/beta fold hydrolase [Planctomycetota bacterium]
MNDLRKFFFVVILCHVPFGTIISQEFPFPGQDKIKGQKSGDYLINTTFYKWSDSEHKTDFVLMNVPENRANKNSRLLQIPVIRIYSDSEEPAKPIFTLAGGPGATNIAPIPPVWLLKNHDLVMVGYRGVDGSVSLQCPEPIEFMKQNSGSPLSKDYLQAFGDAYGRAFRSLSAAGIDIDGYNVIEVVDDIDVARQVLGYNTVNLCGGSWGTRIGYIYGLRYPENVHRMVLTGVNPPGHCIWEPATNDRLLQVYGELWKKDADAVKRSADIILTIRNVLKNLPSSWNGIPINIDHVRMAMFMNLFHVGSAAQLFDAFVAAEDGDYSGIAYLSYTFEMFKGDHINWGEGVAKAISADFDPNRDYFHDMMPQGCLLGSPMSQFMITPITKDNWPMKQIPKEYRELRHSNVEALLISGNLDISTPAANAEKMLRYLPNGKHVILKEMGHLGDTCHLQREAYEFLVLNYLSTGKVDDSKFHYQPINFKPETTFQDIAKSFVAQKK